MTRRSGGFNKGFKKSLVYPVACEYCGRKIHVSWKLVAEHKVPASRGGESTPENMALSCKRCDRMKGILTSEEYLALKDEPQLLHEAKKAIHEELRRNEIRI